MDLAEVDDRLRSLLTRVGEEGLVAHEIRLTSTISQLANNIKLREKMLFDEAGIKNAASSRDVKAFLSEFGYETKSVAQDVLVDFENLVPGIPDIIRVRKYKNLQSRLMSFAASIDMDGIIRYKFKIDHESTGRLYATDFNLQQLPAVGRHCIVPRGEKFVVFDYKQFDLRVMAADSGESRLIAPLQLGADPYITTAQYMFSTENPTPDQRAAAKIVNLAICYGANTRTISHSLKVTSDIANEVLKSYYEAYPTLYHWTKSVVARSHENGYAENRFGRKMVLDFDSDKQKAERQAVAMRGQGGAAEILRSRLLSLEDAGIPFCMTVHDSVILDIESDSVIDKALKILTEPLPVLVGPLEGQSVPLDVSVSTGTSWGTAGHFEELKEDYYAMDFDLTV